jgi:hypothetical protein
MERTPVTQDHEQTDTLKIDVIEPGHDARGSASALFRRTRLELIEREGGRCWLSGMTAEESGHPLEAHHRPVERCFAERWDWPRFARDCKAGEWGRYAQAFDWDSFFFGAETIIAPDTAKPYVKVVDPYQFVDNMLVNGRVLAKQYHTTPDEGQHDLDEPRFLAQKYLAEGYKFSSIEVIHHAQE